MRPCAGPEVWSDALARDIMLMCFARPPEAALFRRIGKLPFDKHRGFSRSYRYIEYVDFPSERQTLSRDDRQMPRATDERRDDGAKTIMILLPGRPNRIGGSPLREMRGNARISAKAVLRAL
jgi:hypothetical protein